MHIVRRLKSTSRKSHPPLTACRVTGICAQIERGGTDNHTQGGRPARSVLEPVHLYWTELGKVPFVITICGLLAARLYAVTTLKPPQRFLGKADLVPTPWKSSVS